jgi:hypothetical protein
LRSESAHEDEDEDDEDAAEDAEGKDCEVENGDDA